MSNIMKRDETEDSYGNMLQAMENTIPLMKHLVNGYEDLVRALSMEKEQRQKLDARVTTLEDDRRRATESLDALPPAPLTLRPTTWVDLIKERISRFAEAYGNIHQQCYSNFYRALDRHYGIRLYARKKYMEQCGVKTNGSMLAILRDYPEEKQKIAYSVCCKMFPSPGDDISQDENKRWTLTAR